MIKAGITGGIGSGKTIICKMFGILGAPAFHADEEARKLYDAPEVRHSMKQRFGDEIYDGDGALNRQLLASRIFSDPAELEFVQGLIHPLVRNQFHEWSKKLEHADYVLYEAAIMIESGSYRELDKLIIITSPEEKRIERVMQRDGVKREDVMRRMHNQWPDDKKVPYADFIIVNDGTKAVLPQVMEIHRELKELNRV